MNVNSKDIAAFVQENGTRYPYNDVFMTRRSFRVKWLLLESQKKQVDRFNKRQWEAIPSSAFDNDTVMHLVVSKQALPVPAENEHCILQD